MDDFAYIKKMLDLSHPSIRKHLTFDHQPQTHLEFHREQAYIRYIMGGE